MGGFEKLCVIKRILPHLASDERFRASYLEDKYQVYVSLVQLLLRLGRTQEAFTYAEKLRARQYLEWMNRGLPPIHDDARRQAELALAKATADQAGVEAEWRVADAELAQAGQRLARIEAEVRRQEELAESLNREGDPLLALAEAEKSREVASAALAAARSALEGQQDRKAQLQAARDEASSALASAKVCSTSGNSPASSATSPAVTASVRFTISGIERWSST